MLYMHRYSSLWHFILSLSSQCYLNDISSRIIFHQWFNHLLLFSDLAAIRRLLDSENATGTCPSCDMPFDKGKRDDLSITADTKDAIPACLETRRVPYVPFIASRKVSLSKITKRLSYVRNSRLIFLNFT